MTLFHCCGHLLVASLLAWLEDAAIILARQMEWNSRYMLICITIDWTVLHHMSLLIIAHGINKVTFLCTCTTPLPSTPTLPMKSSYHLMVSLHIHALCLAKLLWNTLFSLAWGIYNVHSYLVTYQRVWTSTFLWHCLRKLSEAHTHAVVVNVNMMADIVFYFAFSAHWLLEHTQWLSPCLT